MGENMIVLGASGHAKSVVDVVQAVGLYDIVGFVDIDSSLSYRGLRVIGNDDDLVQINQSGVKHAAIGIGHVGKMTGIRDNVIQRAVAAGYSLPCLIDPSAAVASDAVLDQGVFIGKQAVVNACSRIGEFAIVNSGAVVEHDCAVGAGAHIACNATICGGVSIGNGAFVGAGATVIQGVTIGERAIVGAGSVILSDVPAETTVYGVFNG